MIPIRDLNPVQRRPVVTWTIIGLNLLVWAYQVLTWLGGGPVAMNAFIHDYGVIPSVLLSGNPGSLVTPLTSMFMHGGFLHILGNLWFLWVFGDNVEDALGKGRYILFYLLCGLSAVAAHVLIDPTSDVPMVGASGAIAGVLAAYVVLYPRARVVTLVPIVFVMFVELPAFVFIFVWFAVQLASGTVALTEIGQSSGGTAFWAHIGGFVAGLVLVFVMRRRRADRGRVRHVPRRPHREAGPGEWGVDRHRPWR